jgi:hypothetical protein
LGVWSQDVQDPCGTLKNWFDTQVSSEYSSDHDHNRECVQSPL